MTTSSPAIEWLTHRGLGRLVLTVVMLSLLLPASSSAQGESRVTVKKDLIYGRVEGSALLADIASPEGNERLPAIIYVHGGSWRGGSRTGRRSLDVGDWAQSGFFAMTIDYRLVGATPAPAAYLDLLCAIRWVHAHAEEYSIDPERVYLIGNSAGGHLVSLAATLGEGPHARVGGWDDARSDVRAVISASGAYDVNTLSWGTLWTPISGDVEAARRLASRRVRPGSASHASRYHGIHTDSRPPFR